MPKETDEFSKTLEKVPNPIAKSWLQFAMEFARSNESFAVIKPDMPAYDAWLAYFHRIGWTPYVLKGVKSGAFTSWTAPCEWPNQLPPFGGQKPRLVS